MVCIVRSSRMSVSRGLAYSLTLEHGSVYYLKPFSNTLRLAVVLTTVAIRRQVRLLQAIANTRYNALYRVLSYICVCNRPSDANAIQGII